MQSIDLAILLLIGVVNAIGVGMVDHSLALDVARLILLGDGVVRSLILAAAGNLGRSWPCLSIRDVRNLVISWSRKGLVIIVIRAVSQGLASYLRLLVAVLSYLHLVFISALQFVSLLSIGLRGHLAPHAGVLGVDWHAIRATCHDVILISSSRDDPPQQILITCVLRRTILANHLPLTSVVARGKRLLCLLDVLGLYRLREWGSWLWSAFVCSTESSELAFRILWSNLSLRLQIHVLNSFE